MTDKPSRATVFDTATAGSALSEIGDAVRTRLAADKGELTGVAVDATRPGSAGHEFMPGSTALRS